MTTDVVGHQEQQAPLRVGMEGAGAGGVGGADEGGSIAAAAADAASALNKQFTAWITGQCLPELGAPGYGPTGQESDDEEPGCVPMTQQLMERGEGTAADPGEGGSTWSLYI